MEHWQFTIQSQEPDEIFIPYSKQQLNWLLQNIDIWPIAYHHFK